MLIVGRTRYRLPLEGWLAEKIDALSEVLELRVLASPTEAGGGSDERFRLLRPLRPAWLDGLGFYLRLVPALRTELRAFGPDAVVAENPHIGAAVLLARKLAGRPQVASIVEVHGDWRVSTRLYGSRLRRLLNPLADSVAAWAVRRADAVRALSAFTAGLVEQTRRQPPDAVFPTWSDLSAFADRPPKPLPARPTALFVGALELYKNVDGLAAAWPRVRHEVEDARLVVVGTGSRLETIEHLVSASAGSVEHVRVLPPDEVARRMDDSTVLVLPSRFEGLGRVVIESFARGRGVVGGSSGGILDLIDDGVEGLLVDAEDVDGLVHALVRVLADRAFAARLGEAAQRRYEGWHSTPQEFATRVRALVVAGIDRRLSA